MSNDRELARECKAWPFEEARRLQQRLGDRLPDKGYVLFETGYGPSGLPHIGTFAEVVRTTMVRRAFATLTGLPTRLFAFSDDMDGLRKVPDNVPNQDLLAPHLGKPLTEIPDPFGTHPSFGHHNNARLRSFLDLFGFDYEFVSSTECYKSGRFDAALLKMLEHHEEVRRVILPTLGEERRKTYSPFLPVSPKTGRVLQVAIEPRPVSGTIVFTDEDGTLTELPVTGGHCKLQWKADWAMRWFALGVDYEMSGKDLMESVQLSSKICRILGSAPPEGFTYEMFLDENGEKISKSKGNGLSVEEWLAYAPHESLGYFMYGTPRKAKQLHFGVIPKNVDEWLAQNEAYPSQERTQQLFNPVWHVHGGDPLHEPVHLTYSILLNLVSVANTEDPAVLWGFISRYRPDATPETAPILNRLVGYAINYYRDFVKPSKRYRLPDELERAALIDLIGVLERMPGSSSAEELQTEVYEVGKRHPFPDLRSWFKAIYEILFGQSQGPRMGSFIALYGLDETISLLKKALAGELVGE